MREILHIRYHSLFAPRDFDLSPCFEVVKPTKKRGFDYKNLDWSDGAEKATALLQQPVEKVPAECETRRIRPNVVPAIHGSTTFGLLSVKRSVHAST